MAKKPNKSNPKRPKGPLDIGRLQKIRDEIVDVSGKKDARLIKDWYDLEIEKNDTQNALKENARDYISNIQDIAEGLRKSKSTKEAKVFKERLKFYEGVIEKERKNPVLFSNEERKTIEKITTQRVADINKEIKQRTKFTSRIKRFAQKQGINAAGVAGALTGGNPLAIFAANAFTNWRATKREAKEEAFGAKRQLYQKAFSNTMYGGENEKGKSRRRKPLYTDWDSEGGWEGGGEEGGSGGPKILKVAVVDFDEELQIKKDIHSELKVHSTYLKTMMDIALKQLGSFEAQELLAANQRLINDETLDSIKQISVKEKTAKLKPEAESFLKKLATIAAAIAAGIATKLAVDAGTVGEEEERSRAKEANAKNQSIIATNVGKSLGRPIDLLAKAVGLNTNVEAAVADFTENLPSAMTLGIVKGLKFKDFETGLRKIEKKGFQVKDTVDEMNMRADLTKILGKENEKLEFLLIGLDNLQKIQDKIEIEYEKRLDDLEANHKSGKISDEEYNKEKEKIQDESNRKLANATSQWQKKDKQRQKSEEHIKRLSTKLKQEEPTTSFGSIDKALVPGGGKPWTAVGAVTGTAVAEGVAQIGPSGETGAAEPVAPAQLGTAATTSVEPATGTTGTIAPSLPTVTPIPSSSAARPSTTDIPSLGDTQQTMIDELAKQGITDPKAVANILAQAQAESGFKPRSEEISKKKADEDYAKLGGYDYRGRGLIQLTGKANYERYGKMLGVDLVNNPDLANDPDIAARIAAVYYADRGKGKDLTDIQAVNKMTAYSSKVNSGLRAGSGGAEDMRRAGMAEAWEGKLASASQTSSTPLVLAQAAPTSGQQLNDLNNQYASNKETIQTQPSSVIIAPQGGQSGGKGSMVGGGGAASGGGPRRNQSDPINSPTSGLNVVV